MRRPEEGLEQEPLANFVNGGNLAPTIKEGHNPMRCCGNAIKSAEAKNGPPPNPCGNSRRTMRHQFTRCAAAKVAASKRVASQLRGSNPRPYAY